MTNATRNEGWKGALRARLGFVAAGLILLAGCTAAEVSDEQSAAVSSPLEECGPAPHRVQVGDQCLPSCGAAGGNKCSGSPISGANDVGPTWDCGGYCYKLPSCGEAGGNVCSETPRQGMYVYYYDKGPTSDCAYCYDVGPFQYWML